MSIQDLSQKLIDDMRTILEGGTVELIVEDNTNDKSDDGEGLDKVQPKAVKKKFKDRKDKDIDNDGDTDDSDEYLHKKRKAISKWFLCNSKLCFLNLGEITIIISRYSVDNPTESKCN